MNLRWVCVSMAALGFAACANAARAEPCTLTNTFDEELAKLTQLRDDNNRREWLLIEYLRRATGKRETRATAELKDWFGLGLCLREAIRGASSSNP